MPADHKDESNKDESNMDVSLFSVVGHGGMGKTTLAQLVYNDDTVQKSFDLKIWVCVSTPFNVEGLTRSILEQATKQRPNVDDFSALQGALKEKLKTSEKFLLVLDDVWNDDDRSNWEKLLAPLKYGRNGSRILLTTRSDLVADMAARAMGPSTKGSPLKLDGLHGEDFSSLFNRYAFADVDCEDYQNLQRIGMQITNRLGGSPLAAKTVGGLLNSNLDERYWTKILHSKNISDRVQHGKDKIMSILMLSYHHLPLHLRPCFAYCGMFPKDHVFDKGDLVLMWMAVGLIQHSDHQNQGEMLEEMGGDYFDELLRRSLFDHQTYDDYVIHDLLHDLAQSVSHGECFSFVDNDKLMEDIIPNTVRHLYIKSDKLDFLIKMDNRHNLRSLVLRIEDEQYECFSTLEKVFKSLKSIRMLNVDLGYCNVTIPDTFSHLIHLRSLQIDRSILQQFPRSLCKLYNLQTIQFYYDKEFTPLKLPKSMNKLVNLRHLSANYQVAGVGKMIFLQDLSFSVKKERGSKIGGLKELVWLRSLKIQGLENVENQEEASKAKLCNKKYLQTLYLVWSVSGDTGIDKHELVLDSLRPHSNLKVLTIDGYGGIRYANWMGFELINNLRSICFSNCSRLDRLLPFGHYLTALEYLEIKYCPELVDFPSGGLQHLRALKDLKIVSCPKLQVAPDRINPDGNDEKFLPPSLRRLEIERCAELVRVLPILLKGLVSLDKLILKDCEELMSLEGLMGLQSIGRLEIWHCQKLLHVAGTDTFFTLVDTLWIDDPLLLVSGVLRSLTSVRSLTIRELGGMEDLSTLEQWLLQNQTTLEAICMWGASSLMSLPDSLKNLSSLKFLQISKASEALMERCKKDEGADWPNISHIRSIGIIGPCGEETLLYRN